MMSPFRICMSALAVLPYVLLSAPAPEKAETSVPAGDAAPEAKTPPADFARYQTIIDRKPFGREPPNFNPDAPAGSAAAAAAGAEGEAVLNVTEEEQRIISSVRVSVLNVTPRGKVAVGFTDSSKSPAVNYYLLEGESRDGWTFVSADVPEKTVVLSQNGVEATIPLGGGAPEGGGKKGPGRPNLLGRPAASGSPAMPGTRSPAATEPAGRGGAFAQLNARRARKEADQKAEAEARAAAEAQEKADREAAAADREQQRAALLQIQEELRRQREERQQRAAEAGAGGEGADGGQAVQE